MTSGEKEPKDIMENDEKNVPQVPEYLRDIYAA